MMPPPAADFTGAASILFHPLCECTSVPSQPQGKRGWHLGVGPSRSTAHWELTAEDLVPCPYPQPHLMWTHPQAPLPQTAAGHGHQDQAHPGPVQYPCGKNYEEKGAKEGGPHQEGSPTPHHSHPGQMNRMSTHVVPEETNFRRPSLVCWAK